MTAITTEQKISQLKTERYGLETKTDELKRQNAELTEQCRKMMMSPRELEFQEKINQQLAMSPILLGKWERDRKDAPKITVTALEVEAARRALGYPEFSTPPVLSTEQKEAWQEEKLKRASVEYGYELGINGQLQQQLYSLRSRLESGLLIIKQ